MVKAIDKLIGTFQQELDNFKLKKTDIPAGPLESVDGEEVAFRIRELVGGLNHI